MSGGAKCSHLSLWRSVAKGTFLRAHCKAYPARALRLRRYRDTVQQDPAYARAVVEKEDGPDLVKTPIAPSIRPFNNRPT